MPQHVTGSQQTSSLMCEKSGRTRVDGVKSCESIFDDGRCGQAYVCDGADCMPCTYAHKPGRRVGRTGSTAQQTCMPTSGSCENPLGY